MHNQFEKVVITAIGALGLYGNRTAITDLLPFIYAENRNISQKTIETIGSLGLDGLYALIHEIFQRDHNPPFLESFIVSFGGRVLSYLLKEIENEKRSNRRELLQTFYSQLQQKYHIDSPEHSDFLL